MLNTAVSRVSVIAGIVLSLATGSVSHAHDRPIGVLGLYVVDNPQTAAPDEGKIRDLGCTMRRVGVIGSAQGDIGVESPNQFVFLACGTSQLANATGRAMVRDLISTGKSVAMLEGDLSDFPDSQPDRQPSDAVTGRQYIVKISRYNNADADKRDRDLAALGREAGALPDTYVNEAFIGVNSALGLPTPDEVVILFYDDPATGKRFRRNNPKLLKKIGAFNKAHLSDTIYYGGRAIR